MTRWPTVLIITQDFDPTADPIVLSLRDKGATIARFDLSYFPKKLSVTVSDFDEERRSVRLRDRVIDLDAVSGVWYRRPTAFEFDDAMSEAEQQFARNEAMHGVGGILRATDCMWVNRPDFDGLAELKPYHMRVAKRLGLRMPRTLMTNDPDEVGALFDSPHGTAGRIVYKALTGGVIHYPGGFPSGLLTTVVGDEIRDHLGRVQHTICTFQEYIPKAYEIRLTVIGNTYFPVVIRSQDDKQTTDDWRGTEKLKYGDYQPLPDQIVKQCQALLDELNLVYGAIDFIVTPEGEYVFLEVNPNGQFIWMQHDLGIKMSDCFADLLMAGGPFRRGEVTQVGY